MQHTLSNLIMGLKNWPRRSLSQSVCVPVFLWIEIGCVCWWILAPKPTFCPAAALKNWRDELWFATVLSNWFSFSTFIYNHKAVLGACRVSQCDREWKELRSDRLYTRLILIYTHNLQVGPKPCKHRTKVRQPPNNPKTHLPLQLESQCQYGTEEEDSKVQDIIQSIISS